MKYKLLNLDIDFIDFDKLKEIIETKLLAGSNFVINYANMYSLVLMNKSEDVKNQ